MDVSRLILTADELVAITGYRRPYFETQPAYLYPGYRSTVKRSPSRPLVLLPHTLTEVTGPVFGYDNVKPTDNDLTRQHDGEPIGERIVVSGRLLDENSRPVAHALIELWAWNKPQRELTDRSASPWDDASRRPSHADRRNALRRQCLEIDFQRETAATGLGRKIRRLWTRLLRFAA